MDAQHEKSTESQNKAQPKKDRIPWGLFSSHVLDVDSVRKTLTEVYGFSFDRNWDDLILSAKGPNGLRVILEETLGMVNRRWGEILHPVKEEVQRGFPSHLNQHSTLYNRYGELVVQISKEEMLKNQVLDAMFHRLLKRTWEPYKEEPLGSVVQLIKASEYLLGENPSQTSTNVSRNLTPKVRDSCDKFLQWLLDYSYSEKGNQKAENEQKEECDSNTEDEQKKERGGKRTYRMSAFLKTHQIAMFNGEHGTRDRGRQEDGKNYIKGILDIITDTESRVTKEDEKFVGTYLMKRATSINKLIDISALIKKKEIDTMRDSIMFLYLIPDDTTVRSILLAWRRILDITKGLWREYTQISEQLLQIEKMEEYLQFLATMYYPSVTSVFYVLLHICYNTDQIPGSDARTELDDVLQNYIRELRKANREKIEESLNLMLMEDVELISDYITDMSTRESRKLKECIRCITNERTIDFGEKPIKCEAEILDGTKSQNTEENELQEGESDWSAEDEELLREYYEKERAYERNQVVEHVKYLPRNIIEQVKRYIKTKGEIKISELKEFIDGIESFDNTEVETAPSAPMELGKMMEYISYIECSSYEKPKGKMFDAKAADEYLQEVRNKLDDEWMYDNWNRATNIHDIPMIPDFKQVSAEAGIRYCLDNRKWWWDKNPEEGDGQATEEEP